MIDVFASPGAIPVDYTLEGRCCIVIDVLRATTCMTAALENGAAELIPVAEVEAARALRERDAGILLCGERGALPIAGFDWGNSPEDFSEERVAGRRIAMTTTNGTRAILAASGAACILIGCLRNARACAQRARETGLPVTVLCAGTAGRFSAEDILAAGAIVSALDMPCDDLGVAARCLYEAHRDALPAFLAGAEHVRRLHALGLGRDAAYCLDADTSDTVPIFREGIITA